MTQLNLSKTYNTYIVNPVFGAVSKLYVSVFAIGKTALTKALQESYPQPKSAANILLLNSIQKFYLPVWLKASVALFLPRVVRSAHGPQDTDSCTNLKKSNK